MADSASSFLKLRLMEDSVTTSWGDKVDTNMQMLDLAIAGSVTHSSDADLDLTAADADYTADNAKAALINVTATLSAQRTITIPNRKKFYVVKNGDTTYSVVVGTSGGTTRTVTAGSIAKLWCDGSGVTYFVGPLTNATTGAPNTSSGAAASAVSVTPTGNLSSTTAQAALAELQGDIDAINAAAANYQPVDSDLTTIASLSKADGNIMVGDGSAWTVESGATARTSLGAQTQHAYLDDIAAFSDPGADRILGFDDSAGDMIGFALGGGLYTSGTTIQNRINTHVIFTSSDTFDKGDYTGLQAVIVEVWGAGGGGGGSSTTDDRSGGGGGAGGYSRKYIAVGSLGASETVTIGTAGTGGAAGNNSGTSGSATVFGSPDPGHCSGAGGGGGTHNGAGGSGGAGSGGDLNITGGSGQRFAAGSQPGATAIGRDAVMGVGAGGIGGLNGAAGTDATGYGAGGGGGERTTGGSSAAGSNGSGGLCIVHLIY